MKDQLAPSEPISSITYCQARNQEGEAPQKIYLIPMEKCVGHSLKLLDIVQKIWAPLRKLFAPRGVPRWLRACLLRLSVVTAKSEAQVLV